MIWLFKRPNGNHDVYHTKFCFKELTLHYTMTILEKNILWSDPMMTTATTFAKKVMKKERKTAKCISLNEQKTIYEQKQKQY